MTQPPSHEDRVRRILAEYLMAVDRGQAPLRDELLREYPDVAEDIRLFFAEYDSLHQKAQPLKARRADTTPTRVVQGPQGPTLQPRQLFGDYELIEELARGGMGVVFKAKQISLDRMVALKLILAGRLASPEDVLRFHKEAEAAAALDHPNIVPIHEIGEREGHHYFTMKLVEDSVLAHERESLLRDPAAAAEIMMHVARAVHFAHQRGILHRDLKPGNILLQSSSRTRSGWDPYVTDFGLAKRLSGDSTLTQTGAVVGTPNYMAPEQAAGRKDITTAADVYSLGVILYELLTGQRPFQAESPVETLMKVQTQDPVKPRSVRGSIPADLETICLHCLEKNPNQRYASAEALALDLECYLRGDPIRARASMWHARALKWARRRPALTALLAVVITVVGAGFPMVTLLWLTALEQRRLAELARDDARALAIREASARDDLERALYASQLAVAEREWQGLNIARAQEILEECAESQRSWEWDYLHRLFLGTRQSWKAHVRGALAVAFHPAGDILASGGGDGQVALWEVGTAKLATIAGTHRGAVLGVGFSADGSILASGGESKRIHLWDVRGQCLLHSLEADEPIRSLAFHPDGSLFTVSERKQIDIWDVAKGIKKLSWQLPGVQAVAIAGNDRVVTTAGSDATLWSWPERAKLREFRGHRGSVIAAEVNANRTMLATGSSDRTIRIWTLEGEEESVVLSGHQGVVICLAFSPDGKQLVSGGGDGTVRIWNPRKNDDSVVLRGHRTMVQAVAFRPDGKSIASASMDQTIKIWPNGRVDVESITIDREQKCMVLVDSGRALATVDDVGVARIWSYDDGRCLRSLNTRNAPMTCIAYHDIDRVLATGSVDGTVQVARIDEQNPFATLRREKPIIGLRFLQDGKALAVLEREGRLVFWTIGTDESRVMDRPGAYLMASCNARIALAATDHVIYVVDPTDGSRRELKGHTDKIEHMVFSPDGEELATLGVDRTLRIWDIASASERCCVRERADSTFKTFGIDLKIPSAPLLTVVYSADSRRFILASDHSIKVHDSVNGLSLISLGGSSSDLVSLAMCSRAGTLLGLGRSGIVRKWRID